MSHIIAQMIGAILILALPLMKIGCNPSQPPKPDSDPAVKESAMAKNDENPQMSLTEQEWKEKLTPEEYQILRKKGTERPFTGKYDHFFEDGVYRCAGCGELLFISDSKYNSGCGWPAFSAPAAEAAVKESPDTSHGMVRTEITCSKCGGHLGHVFNDGPEPTGLRYCINSAALDFEEEKEP